MPHDQLVHNFYNSITNCEDGTYGPIATAVTLSLKDSADYLGEPLLASSVEPLYSSKGDSFMEVELDEWQTKPVKRWEPHDIVQWVNSEARSLNVCCTELAGEKFAQYDGSQLLSLSKEIFSELDSRYGKILYQRLRDIDTSSCSPDYQELKGANCMRYDSDDTADIHSQNSIITTLNSIREEEPNFLRATSTSTGESNESTDIPPAPAKKKGPGRPKGSKRKKKPEKLGRLWEFLRDLLKNREYCPSLIVWDNYEEGMFRFVHSDKVAKLWGTKKDNPDMNYEKLSRAMRYYYKSQVLLPVYGRRLVYKFGPTATGWKVDNPNFKN